MAIREDHQTGIQVGKRAHESLVVAALQVALARMTRIFKVPTMIWRMSYLPIGLVWFEDLQLSNASDFSHATRLYLDLTGASFLQGM
jgi:hypothetical protein